ncbi:MAG: DUF3991 and toprim domain-containing protein [Oscillospiraceae bacterium]|nr:DUF3991 and toprim domain-containing protein [Oscillospiraceae bacterium]
MSTFIPFTREDIHQAKHADLASFLASRGETVKRSGSEQVWLERHITIRGHQFYDHYENVGGTAIDFVQKYFAASFQEAVQQLLGHGVVVESIERQRIRPEFKLPPRNSNMRRVYAYLLKQRCIDRAVLDFFTHHKLIYEDAKYHNVVFVGVDADGTARHAHKKSTASQKSWRANQAGSDAKFAFHHIDTSEKIFAFESPIDMLSFISMHPKDWRQHSYVALCGVSDEALMYQLKTHEHLREVVLCLDNDEAGHMATGRISQALQGYAVEVQTPRFKDFNEDLVALRQVEELHCVITQS